MCKSCKRCLCVALSYFTLSYFTESGFKSIKTFNCILEGLYHKGFLSEHYTYITAIIQPSYMFKQCKILVEDFRKARYNCYPII